MIEDVKRLLDDYEDGACTLMGLYNDILSLSLVYSIEEVIVSLPPQLRGDFLAWARQTFDNDIPVDKFVIVNGGLPSDADTQPILRIREWFRNQVETPDK